MIIGVTGTLGAGKGTVVEYLVSKKGFIHYSVRDFLKEEIARRGLPANRDTMTAVANDLRAIHGPSYITEQLYAQAQKKGGDAVIESIRSLGEGSFLKGKGCLLWAVDADIRTRYARVVERASETDAISFEKFVEDEKRELANTDPAKQNLAGLIEQADAVFLNDGNKEELFAQIETSLSS